MKRSSQVLLAVMGMTSSIAVGHYLAQPRTECVPQASAAKPGTTQQVSQQSGSRSSWYTCGGSSSSNSSSSSSSERIKIASSQTSAPGAARGGFGSTGNGISSSS